MSYCTHRDLKDIYPSIDEFALTEEQKYYWGKEGSKMRENIKEKVE